MDKKIIEFDISEIKDLISVASYLCGQDYSKIICLEGDLGAGKTTLVNAICKMLKSEDETSSPTFSIVNEYTYPKGIIYHFDLYRLNNSDELMDIGIEEYLSSNEYCLIEWPELAIETILDQYLSVKIEVNSDNSRKILISNA